MKPITRIAAIATAAAFSITLIGCNSQAPTAGQPGTPEQTELHGPPDEAPGLPTWKPSDGRAEWACFDDRTGVTYTIPVPVDTSDKRIQAVEEFRKKAGASPVNYLLVEVDATAAHASGQHGLWGADWATVDHQNAGAVRAYNAENGPMDWEGWSSNPGSGMPELEEDANTGAKGWAILLAKQPIESMVAPTVTTGAYQPACDLYPPSE